MWLVLLYCGYFREKLYVLFEIITVTTINNCSLESVGIMLIESANLLNVLYGNYC